MGWEGCGVGWEGCGGGGKSLTKEAKKQDDTNSRV